MDFLSGDIETGSGSAGKHEGEDAPDPPLVASPEPAHARVSALHRAAHHHLHPLPSGVHAPRESSPSKSHGHFEGHSAPGKDAKPTPTTEETQEHPSILLLSLPEVFVYKIPPLQGSRGHHAADWNLEKPALTGQLRIVSNFDKFFIQIWQVSEDPTQPPPLFATAPVRLDPNKNKPASRLDYFLQPVVDSSRYFVLRLEDEQTKRHAYIGIGFQERQSAFDMKATIDDEVKRIERGVVAQSAASEQAPAPKPVVDRSLKEGETIKIKIGGIGGKKKDSSDRPELASLKLNPPGLKPPPSGAKRQMASQSTEEAMKNVSLGETSNQGDGDVFPHVNLDEEFGDFQ